jgi:hypothetical protein
VLAVTLSHAPDAEVFVEGTPAPAYVETTLDLEGPETELNLLLDEQLKNRGPGPR